MFLKPKTLTRVTDHFSRARSFDGATCGSNDFLSEERFRKALSLERRRAERSHKLFLLVLLATEPVEDFHKAERLAQRAANALSMLADSIRETDIWGWYKQDSIGGIIFTEFNGTARQIILSALSEKIDSVLRRAFDPEERKHVQLSFHFFPEPWTGSGDASTHNPALYPDLEERNKAARFSRSFKRAIDFVGSLLLLILLSPALAAIAVAIKLDSRGPVLFKQDRVGQYGTRFTFLKFRSMVVECDPNIHKEYIQRFIAGESGTKQPDAKGRGVFKLAKDSRVTRFGRWLRKTSLDELPQLVNVLTGEMSLVGPRPPIPYELESYYVWHTRRVLETKPGITGLWQVRGRSRTTFDEMVRMDLQYARTWSLWLDLRILLQTPHAVIFGRGAY